MSALTDLFQSMANKIRSKTGTATTYTPPQMVSNGIDDVYAAGIADATTSITPSNANPVSMAANTGYKPTAAGYAISSYNSVTPSNSSPVALASGDIDKMGGNGYAIQSYSSVTPSNSSPVSLSSGSIYKMGGAGKAVASVTTLTPSDSSPATISSGTVYKASANGYAIGSHPEWITPSDSYPNPMSENRVYITINGGYAIASYQNKTPSAQGTPFNSGFVKMSSSGYAYSEKPSITYDTLWSNPSPTSSFASQTVTLTDNIANYDFIKIWWRVSDTVATEASILVPKAVMQASTESQNVPIVSLDMYGETYRYVRFVYYAGTNKLKFTEAGRWKNNSSNNLLCLPMFIQGVKLNNVVTS